MNSISTDTDWCVGPSLTIYAVAELERTSPLVAEPQRVWTVDVSGVEEVDAAGIQWLLSVTSRARRSGGDVVLGAGSPIVAQALEMTGAAAWFVASSPTSAED